MLRKMAINYKLRERDTGKTIYPETSTGQVYAPDGRNLDAVLPDLQNQVKGKQPKIIPATGLAIDEETGELSLTARAKQMLFDDLWTAAGCTVDHSHVEEDGVERHYCCNELWLTYDEAVYIYNLGPLVPGAVIAFYRTQSKCRTFLPSRVTRYAVSGQVTYAECYALEVVDCGALFRPSEATFANCGKLRKIGLYSINPDSGTWAAGVYAGCKSLETIEFSVVFAGIDIYLPDSPLISLETLQRIHQRYGGSKPITAFVHPDVYAKLTGDTSNAAAAALSEEELAQWVQVLVDCAAKNVTFATVE